jgi:hypothetical protein
MAPSEGESAEDVFAERLREAVLRAHEGDVDVEGSWPVPNEDPDVPDWDLVIVRMAKPIGRPPKRTPERRPAARRERLIAEGRGPGSCAPVPSA